MANKSDPKKEVQPPAEKLAIPFKPFSGDTTFEEPKGIGLHRIGSLGSALLEAVPVTV